MEPNHKEALEKFLASRTDQSNSLLSLVSKDSFREQRLFIDDPAKHKALHCTRRAAKSYTAGLYMVETCLKYPGSNCLFIALTRETAHGIIDKDILQIINRRHKLGKEINKNLINQSLPKGSIHKPRCNH